MSRNAFGWSWVRKALTRKASSRRFVPAFEALEARQLLSLCLGDQTIAKDDSFPVVPGSLGNMLNVLANDVGLQNPMVEYGPTYGTASAQGGVIRYDAPQGQQTPDWFVYAADDGQGNCYAANVSITFTTPVGSPPVANDDPASGDAYVVANNQPWDSSALAAAGSLLTNDTDPDGNTLTVAGPAVTGPSRGTVQINTTTGTFIYTPNAGYTGEDMFTYRVSDGTQTSNDATVRLRVVNWAPPAFPPLAPPDDCTCQPGVIETNAGIRPSPAGFGDGPVRLFDGALQYAATDLGSAGFGKTWGQTRSWTNATGYADGKTGPSTAISQLPFVKADGVGSDAKTFAVVSGGTNARYFDKPEGGSTYTPRFFSEETLADSGTNLVLTDTEGNVLTFYGFDASINANLQGQLQSVREPSLALTAIAVRDGLGRPTRVQRSDPGMPGTFEYYDYTYSGALLTDVSVTRQAGGQTTSVRQAHYTYDPSGTLQLAEVRDGQTVLETYYYRYYGTEAGGYAGALKYVFGPEAYARLKQNVSNWATETDAAVAPYADLYLEYNATTHRVTKAVVAGAGSANGQGTYTYFYDPPSTHPLGFNSWKNLTTEVLPDGSQNFVYTNFAGQEILRIFRSTSGQLWLTFHQYDDQGRLVLTAHPSAVSGYDPAKPDLLGFNPTTGRYDSLRDSTGLIETTTYYAATTAGENSPGGVTGYVRDTAVQRGELGARVLQQTVQYSAHTGGGATVYPVATEKVYRDEAGTQPLTTTYVYTWHNDSTQAASVIVTRPAADASQNGSGNAVIEETRFDANGRATWHEDADGYLHYTAYDPVTGAVVQTTDELDPARTDDNLVTQFEVDALGRVTKQTDAEGHVTYTVHKDDEHEVRTYPGWHWDATTGAYATTGPIRVTREDPDNRYSDSFTIAAAPASNADGEPTGAEVIGALYSLTRSYRNNAGQVIRTDEYFNLVGLGYSTVPYQMGTKNVHFYTTEYAYDAGGRLARTYTPTDTIYRTVYDNFGRVASTWVGTNDTPGNGQPWSPANNTLPANMVKVSENAYDADGNPIQTTVAPGGGASDRVTQFFLDWRGRVVATKQGVQDPLTENSTAGKAVNRPIVYVTYDNLGHVLSTSQYDGDGVSIVDSNNDGVPDHPSTSLRRAYSTTAYDNLGRVYRTSIYSVNQDDGILSAAALTTDVWYNQRGQVLMTAAPGGPVTETQYDGAGRPVKSFTTDGRGGLTWANAGNATGDVVLSQTETQYDKNGNVLLVTQRDRFHDQGTATGELGTATTGVRARVSYVASYYDQADRLIASADLGTNTADLDTDDGITYRWKSTIPSRSDRALVMSYSYDAAGWQEIVTDPRNLKTKTTHDALGRVIRVVEAWTGAAGPTATSDRTTSYAYYGDGHLWKVISELPGGLSQTTQYIYGARTTTGSDLNSFDLNVAVWYPDKTTGQPTNTEQESYTFNALEERTSLTDRNGTKHVYTYDVLGRQTVDKIEVLGAGVDAGVMRRETAYDQGGRPYLFTSYNAATGGTITNQVWRSYDGLGQLVAEFQAHSGAVVPASSPVVRSVYSFTGQAGGPNHSRLVSMTYPNGRVLTYDYGAAGGIDDRISRVSSLKDGAQVLETYSYLGQGTVVRRQRPQNGTELRYFQYGPTDPAVGDGGDPYTGLDRFGRVVDQRWLYTLIGTDIDRFQYGYDADGNRLFKKNLIDAAFSELYHADGAANGYDNLNQLTAFRRGTLTDTNADGIPDSILGTASRSQDWTLDAMGNWDLVTSTGPAGTDDRTHNAQNQITSIAGQTTPTYDRNGNMTRDQAGRTLSYDAWNRLVVVSSGGAPIAVYAYDALNRRTVDYRNPVVRDFYYDASWQLVEERVAGAAERQYVWAVGYVDGLVLRDRNADGNSANGLEERRYVQQDANWNVTALADTNGGIRERYAYDPYGAPTILTDTFGTRAVSESDWNYLHQGGRYDATVGLYHFRNREYSPVLGRWMSQDPLGFDAGDTNYYRYEANGPANTTDPSGKAPLSYAGLDVKSSLIRTMDKVEREWYKLSLEQKIDLARGLTTPPTAARSWDIEEFYKTEQYGGPWVQGKYGEGAYRKYVTVGGEVHFAGAVNYILWGKMNRLIHDMIYEKKGLPPAESSWRDFLPYFCAGGLHIMPNGHPNVPQPGQYRFTLDHAIRAVKTYREMRTSLGASKESGIDERVAWVKVGWYGDFSYASPYKGNNIAMPSPEEYTGSFHVRVIGETITWRPLGPGATVTESRSRGRQW